MTRSLQGQAIVVKIWARRVSNDKTSNWAIASTRRDPWQRRWAASQPCLLLLRWRTVRRAIG
jgi:hypothetical protein